MKRTKGKQKIEMKKVESYEARRTTFSKRKAGILKKMNEIIAVCDVEASFLVFSESGYPRTFAHPSMEDAVDRVKCSLGHEPSGKDDASIGSLVEAYKRQKNEELKKKLCDLAEELKMVKEKEKKMVGKKKIKESKNEWSNILNEGVNKDELKRVHQAIVELNYSLSGKALQRLGKDGDGSSSALAERGHCDGGEAGAGEQT
ncbi:hypothetical protein F2Q69_00040135 [Brassica cretica]|uniref:MADS-box domain-containing protein n=1 Tax=Brassica cretica TaxID=69181 RepID=A0A8S9NN71_BRACR|nr:hypothetical protein F2Q69_00040135 [Brassica cretica]